MCLDCYGYSCDQAEERKEPSGVCSYMHMLLVSVTIVWHLSMCVTLIVQTFYIPYRSTTTTYFRRLTAPTQAIVRQIAKVKPPMATIANTVTRK